MAVTQVDVGGSLAKGLQVNQMRQQMEAQKQAQESKNALRALYAERFGGTDPKTGITWDTGRQQTVTNAGRPLYTDAATGERYSEKSMTTQLPNGQWTNFPTVDRTGRILPEDEAFRMVQQAGMRDPITGRQLETYGSMGDAVSSAQGRSAGLTAQSQPMMSNQDFVGRAMAIDPQTGMAWQDYFSKQSAAELERNKAEAPIIVAAFEGVQDQAGYDRARQFVASQGVDVSDIPPQFDPATTRMVVQGSRYLAGNWPSAPAPSNVAKLIAERDALPQGDPRRATYDAAITKASTNAPGTTVTVDTGGNRLPPPPTDMAYVYGEDGKVKLDERGVPIALPIKGTKLYASQQGAETAESKKRSQEERTANYMVEDIDRITELMKSADLPTTGGAGALTSTVPGTASYDIGQLLVGLQANIGFDRLQQMREASPTGGALGNVTEGELARLSAVYGSVVQSQSEEQFRRNLARLKEMYLDTIHGPGNRPEQPAPEGLPDTAEELSKLSDEEVLKRLGIR